MAEIAFEVLALALEATRGTAVTPPTHYANLEGVLKPAGEWYEPVESRGELEETHRSVKTREWGEWEASGPLDVDLTPVFLNMLVKGGIDAPTSTPAGATNSRLWAFVPTITSDDLETATFYWGDPNVQLFRGAFGYIDELKITADATGTDGATMELSGMSQMPISEGVITNVTQANPGVVTSAGHGLVAGDSITITGVVGMTELNGNTYTVASPTANTFALSATNTTGFTAYVSGGVWTLEPPTFPSQTIGALIPALYTQIWLDTSSAIGTTELSGRVVSAEVTIPGEIVPKYLGKAPGTGLSYSRIGRGRRRPSAKVVFEFLDTTQYRIFKNDTLVKCRIRMSSAQQIETVSGVTFYNYVECDVYGKLKFEDWGDLEGVNRTVDFTIDGIKDSTLGASFRIAVQNDNTTL